MKTKTCMHNRNQKIYKSAAKRSFSRSGEWIRFLVSFLSTHVVFLFIWQSPTLYICMYITLSVCPVCRVYLTFKQVVNMSEPMDFFHWIYFYYFFHNHFIALFSELYVKNNVNESKTENYLYKCERKENK